ncbi:dephospho-CoA kinase [Tepidibacillus fermentans]|uniref:Dephospho-CoA kinase n=1 Tax=Tepidibacillus fermentans TaxID=1281767 RepID=A0A4V2UT05_9BACI|nr:dephospho-CoA kinase [Tepidibacillus fermentans]
MSQLIIGLTGGIGSGKSTVAKLFRKYGVPVVDVDLIAREVVEPGKEAWRKIIEHFGEKILLPNQQIDRKKLGNIIFQDEKERKILNEITHPIIIRTAIENAKELEKKNSYVIVDIPLLFESKREKLFDQIIVVYVPFAIQLKRLMKRDQISKEEAIRKMKSQIDLEEKKKKADIVIYNDKGIEQTEEQVVKIITDWQSKRF